MGDDKWSDLAVAGRAFDAIIFHAVDGWLVIGKLWAIKSFTLVSVNSYSIKPTNLPFFPEPFLMFPRNSCTCHRTSGMSIYNLEGRNSTYNHITWNYRVPAPCYLRRKTFSWMEGTSVCSVVLYKNVSPFRDALCGHSYVSQAEWWCIDNIIVTDLIHWMNKVVHNDDKRTSSVRFTDRVEVNGLHLSRRLAVPSGDLLSTGLLFVKIGGFVESMLNLPVQDWIENLTLDNI